jgi:hypothetical protein
MKFLMLHIFPSPVTKYTSFIKVLRLITFLNLCSSFVNHYEILYLGTQ